MICETPRRRAIGDEYIVKAFEPRAGPTLTPSCITTTTATSTEKLEKTIRLIRELGGFGARASTASGSSAT